MMRVIARFGDLTASSRSSAAMSFELRFKLHRKNDEAYYILRLSMLITYSNYISATENVFFAVQPHFIVACLFRRSCCVLHPKGDCVARRGFSL